jgi:hypothetical protein
VPTEHVTGVWAAVTGRCTRPWNRKPSNLLPGFTTVSVSRYSFDTWVMLPDAGWLSRLAARLLDVFVAPAGSHRFEAMAMTVLTGGQPHQAPAR